ncbi:hypothetical protein Q8A67_018470 [Cirrhinus molitorella]|uniref:Uncharacterized protein n=1 Tax=Cirrhinus molitorella TaxID=172907 RepID=A0AA88TG62_9TELE|nr:hypothetical protein Q8A67_018470 [Cirrhinus molitorella]
MTEANGGVEGGRSYGGEDLDNNMGTNDGDVVEGDPGVPAEPKKATGVEDLGDQRGAATMSGQGGAWVLEDCGDDSASEERGGARGVKGHGGARHPWTTGTVVRLRTKEDPRGKEKPDRAPQSRDPDRAERPEVHNDGGVMTEGGEAGRTRSSEEP